MTKVHEMNDPNESEIVLEVEKLTFAYDVENVVKDVSFKVRRGEIIGILGPNGAGKTTTIRLITGVLPLPRGPCRVRINGESISTNGQRCKMNLGIIPEVSNAFLDLTVWENIMFSGRVYGVRREELRRRAEELLDKFGLKNKKHAKTRALSKGLKQRMNFCMALLHDPPILILDEPTSGLDPISVNVVRERIKQFKKEGKTILLTTHDLQEAEKLCDKVLIMNRGRIIAFKSPGELRDEFKIPAMIIFKVNGKLDDDTRKGLLEIPGIEEISGNTFKITTHDPFKDICRLDKFLVARKLECDMVRASMGSLEDIFLKIVENDNN